MNFYLDTLNIIQEKYPEIIVLDLKSEATYYAQNTRRQIYNCLLKTEENTTPNKCLLKIYQDPRTENKEFENTNYLPSLLPDKITMAKVLLGSSDNTETLSRGWYLMEKLDLQQNIDWKTYIELYQDYFNNLNYINSHLNLEIPHLNNNLDSSLWIQQRITKWYNLPKQTHKFSAIEQKQINSELENSLQTFLPLLEKYFSGQPLCITHGHFVPKEIYTTQDPHKFHLTDYGHLSYQYLGYDLSLAIWSEAIMNCLQSNQLNTLIPQTQNLIQEVQSLNIFKNKNYIVFSILERCLGTLYADLWASNADESKESKLSKHQTILELIKTLDL